MIKFELHETNKDGLQKEKLGYSIIPLINFIPKNTKGKFLGPSDKEVYFTLSLMKRGHPHIETMIQS